MNRVIDASVALKWFIDEPRHEEARALLRGGDSLHAPDLLALEVTNAAWKKVVRKEIERAHAAQIAQACRQGTPTLHRSADLLDRALRIAIDLAHPVYDCLYLACAEATGSILITADKRLHRAVRGSLWEVLVQPLGDAP